MKNFILVLFVFSVSLSYAQIENKVNPADAELYDEFTELFIPRDARWMGLENEDGTDYRFVEDRTIIYHFWSPFNLRDSEVLKRLSSIQQDYPDVLIIDFLHPFYEGKFTPEEAFSIWRKRVEGRPLVTKVNEKLKRVLDNPELNRIIISTKRSGVTSLDILNSPEDVEKLLQILKENNSQEKLETLPTFPLNKFTRTDLFNFPRAIACDELIEGLFVCDTENSRVLGINDLGEVEYVIGNTTEGYADGNIALARFRRPEDIVFDSESRILYVADTHNHVIRKIDFKSLTVSTWLGTGSEAVILTDEVRLGEKSLAFPSKMVLKDGHLFVSMKKDNSIYKVNIDTGAGERILKGANTSVDGKREEASVSNLANMSLDQNGDLLILENGKNPKIRRLTKKSLKTIYSSSTSNDSISLDNPLSIHQLGNSIYILDSFNHTIRKLDEEGLSQVAGSSKGLLDGSLEESLFNTPTDLCTMNGKIFVLDGLNNAIRMVSPSDKSVLTLNVSNGLDWHHSVPITKLEIKNTRAFGVTGQNLITLKLNLPESEMFVGTDFIIEAQSGSKEEIIKTDPKNGLIVYTKELGEDWEPTYMSIILEAKKAEVPNHTFKYAFKALIEYDPTTDRSKVGTVELDI